MDPITGKMANTSTQSQMVAMFANIVFKNLFLDLKRKSTAQIDKERKVKKVKISE
jgi:hypothetical protein